VTWGENPLKPPIKGLIGRLNLKNVIWETVNSELMSTEWEERLRSVQQCE